MSVLTFEETKKRHKEMWMWIAKRTAKKREAIDKNQYFEKNGISDIPAGYCYCCDFDIALRRDISLITQYCKLCPVKNWGGEKADNLPFPCNRGLYRDWCEETDWQKAADLAEQIANLPLKKAFDITPEQAKLLRDKGFGEIYSTEEISHGS